MQHKIYFLVLNLLKFKNARTRVPSHKIKKNDFFFIYKMKFKLNKFSVHVLSVLRSCCGTTLLPVLLHNLYFLFYTVFKVTKSICVISLVFYYYFVTTIADAFPRFFFNSRSSLFCECASIYSRQIGLKRSSEK